MKFSADGVCFLVIFSSSSAANLFITFTLVMYTHNMAAKTLNIDSTYLANYVSQPIHIGRCY